jgi:protoporphyrinogen oxidase
LALPIGSSIEHRGEEKVASTIDNSMEDADCGSGLLVGLTENDARELAQADSIGFAVLGGGPAGLTGAYALGLRGLRVEVFEADRQVGGIAKTVEVDGYRFDLGGHRFFTKLKQIEALWVDVLGEELLTRPRLSRIYYNGKFFAYPLTSKDVVGRLGLWESGLCALSYLWALRNRRRRADSFEDWVTARFGRRLYEVFFRSYSEKVWGIPGSEIRSLWAAQRIKNFSLWKAALTILGIRRDDVTTLIEEFKYPRLGPGQMWELLQQRLEERYEIPVRLNHRVTRVRHNDWRVESVVVEWDGDETEFVVDGALNTLALQDLVAALDPPPPDHVLEAASKLRYRDFCLVALMTSQDEPFPDNWIYIHDPGTRAGRVQNFGAWSSDMVLPGTTCLGVEYFCFEGDEIWEMSSEDAVAMATEEMARIGLVDQAKVIGGAKVRVPKAYPMYDRQYEAAVAEIKMYLEGFENLQTCGRNGLHRYNNQDHSMWTAIFASLNLVEDRGFDVWSVNADEVYLEEGEVVDELLDLQLVG